MILTSATFQFFRKINRNFQADINCFERLKWTKPTAKRTWSLQCTNSLWTCTNFSDECKSDPSISSLWYLDILFFCSFHMKINLQSILSLSQAHTNVSDRYSSRNLLKLLIASCIAFIETDMRISWNHILYFFVTFFNDYIEHTLQIYCFHIYLVLQRISCQLSSLILLCVCVDGEWHDEGDDFAKPNTTILSLCCKYLCRKPEMKLFLWNWTSELYTVWISSMTKDLPAQLNSKGHSLQRQTWVCWDLVELA